MPALKDVENQFLVLHNEITNLTKLIKSHSTKDVQSNLHKKRLKYKKLYTEILRLKKKQTS
jgi:hypothetical protein